MKYKPYPAYKDSGVEWLGDVPEEWEAKPLKRLSSCNDDVLPESTDAETEIEYVDISSVSSVGGIEKTDLIRFDAAPSRARRKVKAGDVIISTVRTYLKAIASVTDEFEHVVVSTGFAVIRPENGFEPSFARYALHANYFMDQVVAESVGVSYPAINASELTAIKVAVPNPSEQTAIATFLDCETAKLDTLIAKQKKLIELLQEKRKALASHAVTKGLNPDAPMKDSGVKWLGKVPAHWEALPTKRIFGLIVDPAPANNDYELLSIYTDIGVRPRKELEEKGNKASTTDGYFRVKKGDFIVNKLLAWMGAIGLSQYDGVTSPAYDILRQKRAADPRFYEALFRCGVMFTEFRRYSRGIMDMRLRLYFDEFGQIVIPCPPEKEQRAIADWIATEQGKIDALIEKSRRSIELMREHRTALISAAVTGKIDVRAQHQSAA